MKKRNLFIAAVLLLALGMFSCHKKGAVPFGAKINPTLIKDTTSIEFLDSVTYQFVTLTQAEKAEHDFRIPNTGDKELIIADAHGDCGCTVPSYPKEPVKPGETVTIHVTFNSAGKHDQIHKTVTMTCNTVKRSEHLYMDGFVKKKGE